MSEDFCLKTINDLLGMKFFIPWYQRGYRWTEKQVKDLLDDIWEFCNGNPDKGSFYCLQPIVVKQIQIGEYEVIDGQQRLTTVYLVLKYLRDRYLGKSSLKADYGAEIFRLQYDTRPGSEQYLQILNEDNSNMDYYYLNLAYRRITKWFEEDNVLRDRSDKERFLGTILGREDSISVKIIWYLVDQDANSRELFSRLNIGKIQLTNAELIKALFLSTSSFRNLSQRDQERYKLQISIFWDEMEKRLSDKDFWAFISNYSYDFYSNRIEILFDLMADKGNKSRDPLFTFFYFVQLKENRPLWDVWIDIENYFNMLQEWYLDNDLYHKIGFLIRYGDSLKTLLDESQRMKKDEFKRILNDKIRRKVAYNLYELEYSNNGDIEKIERVLVLFNIESLRQSSETSERMPFRYLKERSWSIEHIHAQNTEGMDQNKKKPWIEWCKIHLEILNDYRSKESGESIVLLDRLIEEGSRLNEETITWGKFVEYSTEVIQYLSFGQNDDQSGLHSIGNLALLSSSDNSALNNSVFAKKRKMIMEKDRKGDYLPICTKRVFFKYYNPKAFEEQYYFWTDNDQEKYIEEIKRVLAVYLPTRGDLK